MEDRLFRDAMGKFATGVTVITTEIENEVHGMTANAFMSVSLDPKLISISIDERAGMHGKLKHSGKFAVNILSEKQQDISMHFAGQKKENREINFDWLKETPVIKDSLVTIVCNVYSTHKAGDHTLFIGEVIHVETNEDHPLTFYKGQYGLETSHV
ncbi:flavin reductase family protein [Halobacillus naozhouensis]|uniref:Flavin reductase family protein n=1 Tax=Halobacillus naozhouensis TaxID=554880 RepID=A0ABY8IYJ5_9BACI|nr:flavin reductase family protein [Halobacillus naozhouensis]WFT75299.1 flavin reductase family protein [Halobacillus naozhouensis]